METNKITPEERLKRYKKYLAKLAEKEGRELVSVKSVQETIVKSPEVGGTSSAYDKPSEAPRHSQKPRKIKKRSFVSPSKQELEELKKAVATKASKKKKRKLSGKSLTMLRVRSKALTKALTEMKVKREKLERQFDRGIIDQREYQQILSKYVSEGHELLSEKTEIDEEIKILESKSQKK